MIRFGNRFTWLPIGYVLRGLLNRKDRKDTLYIITLSTGIQYGKLYIRDEESTEWRCGLVGYTYVEGNKKCAGRMARKMHGWWGLNGSVLCEVCFLMKLLRGLIM